MRLTEINIIPPAKVNLAINLNTASKIGLSLPSEIVQAASGYTGRGMVGEMTEPAPSERKVTMVSQGNAQPIRASLKIKAITYISLLILIVRAVLSWYFLRQTKTSSRQSSKKGRVAHHESGA